MSKAEEIAALKRKLELPLPESAKERIRQRIAAAENSAENSSNDDVSKQISDLERKLELPLPESAKDRIRARIAALKGSAKPKEEPKKEVKPKAKKPTKKVAPPKEPKVKFVKKKVQTKEKEPTPMDIKPTPKKRGRKPSPKKEEVAKEPKVVKKRGRKPKKKETPATKTRVKKVFKPTKKVAEGEPDCDTLLKQFRERRAKAKASQKKRKTTPVFRKIASDVVDAVEKAIKNVPAKQIKESPKVVIRKFGNLQKAADSFLKAFREVLGADYQKSQAEVEINDLKRLVEKLIKKYSQK
jgi:hypothetical protein